MKLYLDLCVYNRPFDDQGQPRIALETNAFIYVLEMVEDGKCTLVTSDAVLYENSKNPNEERRVRVQSYLKLAKERIRVQDTDIERANFLKGLGFSGIDALHLTIAERAGVNYLITCDDDIVKNYKKHLNAIMVEVLSIMEFVAKEGKQE